MGVVGGGGTSVQDPGVLFFIAHSPLAVSACATDCACDCGTETQTTSPCGEPGVVDWRRDSGGNYVGIFADLTPVLR